jgi:hypothetical protein
MRKFGLPSKFEMQNAENHKKRGFVQSHDAGIPAYVISDHMPELVSPAGRLLAKDSVCCFFSIWQEGILFK